jgi:hypothetical protein
MVLDVNIDVYPVSVGEKFTIAFAPTLNLDGTPDTGYFIQVSNALYGTFLQHLCLSIICMGF